MPRPRLLPARLKQETPNTSLAIVNIVFLLLFFFLVTGAYVQGPDFEIRISRIHDDASGTYPKPVLLVDDAGEMKLNGTAIAKEDLAQAVAGLKMLDIVINRDAPAQDLLKLLETPGFEVLDLRLVTEKLVSQE